MSKGSRNPFLTLVGILTLSLALGVGPETVIECF